MINDYNTLEAVRHLLVLGPIVALSVILLTGILYLAIRQ